MFKPPPPYQGSGSFKDVLKRMTQHAQQEKVDEKIFEIMKQAFETGLNKENIILSRPERVRLFKQVTKNVLSDVLEKIDGKK